MTEKWPGRAGEIAQVKRFLSAQYSQELGNGVLCVYGNRATGKSAVICDLLETSGTPFVHIDRLAYDMNVHSRTNNQTRSSSTLLYSLIVARLTLVLKTKLEEEEEEDADADEDYDDFDDDDDEEEEEEDVRRVPIATVASAKHHACSTFPLFQTLVETLLPPPTSTTTSPMMVVIVLDDADYLAARTAWFDQLLGINAATRRNVRLILVSRDPMPAKATTQLFFPPYSAATCETILLHHSELAQDNSDDFNDNHAQKQQQQDKFAKLVRFVFHKSHLPGLQDLLQAAYSVRVLWRASLAAGTAADWTAFTHCRVLLVELTRKFRDVGNTFLATRQLLLPGKEGTTTTAASLAMDLDRLHLAQLERQAGQLPNYIKVLLLACYLAANNPREQDLVLFGDKQVRRRTVQPHRKHQRLDGGGGDGEDDGEDGEEDDDEDASNGRKSFPMARVQYLFNGLVSDLYGSQQRHGGQYPVCLVQGMEVLLQKRVVTRVGQNELLAQRFRCITPDDYCDAVCRTLGLELNNYLFSARGR